MTIDPVEVIEIRVPSGPEVMVIEVPGQPGRDGKDGDAVVDDVIADVAALKTSAAGLRTDVNAHASRLNGIDTHLATIDAANVAQTDAINVLANRANATDTVTAGLHTDVNAAFNQIDTMAQSLTAETQALSPASVGVTFDGGGSVIAAGTRVDIVVPFAGAATAWTLLADVSATSVVNVYKTTFANAPPTVADKITALAPPNLVAGVKATSSVLTGWTTAVAAGDVITFIVDSNDNAKRLSVGLVIRR